jgi:TPR repeat protein
MANKPTTKSAPAGAVSAGPNFDQAIDSYRRGDYAAALGQLQSLAERGDAMSQYVLGLMHELGQGVGADASQAIFWYRKAAAQGQVEAQYNLGSIYAQGRGVAQDFAEAKRWFSLAADAGNATAQYSLGVIYYRGRGVAPDFAEAARWYRLAAEQGLAEAQNNLGVMYDKGQGVAKDYTEAMRWSRLAAEQGDSAAQNNVGLMYHDGRGVEQDFESAMRWFRLAADTGHVAAQVNLAHMYHVGRGVAQNYAEAVRLYRKALERGDGKAQQDLVARYREGLNVAPDEAEAMGWLRLAAEQGGAGTWLNLGVMYTDAGLTQEAIACYDRALAIEPDSAQAKFNRGLSLLTLGDYARGWVGYEARWDTKDSKLKRPGRRWLGEDVRGKTVLVTIDQGFGDSLQFVRVLPQLKQRGAHVVMETYPKLYRLMQSAAGIDELIKVGDAPPAHDFYCPLVSVAAVLQMNAQSDFDMTAPYLKAPEGAGAKLAPALAASGHSFKVGIAWSGNVEFSGDRRKSTSLVTFLPMTGVPGVRLFSLQFGPRAEQIKSLGVGAAIGDLTPLIDDFADTAVALAGLDLLISVDTGMVHLAGVLGRPTWVILHPGSDFRWLKERDDSPWYPSLRLFRMKRQGDWEEVLGRVVEELRKTVSLKLQEVQ